MTVDGPGFHVEPDVLESAATGMSGIVRDQDTAELRTLPTSPEVYGNPDAHAAMTSFCASWSVGVDALCDRARWMGTSLSDAARAYRDADRGVADALGGDPAAPVVADDGGPVGPSR